MLSLTLEENLKGLKDKFKAEQLHKKGRKHYLVTVFLELKLPNVKFKMSGGNK